MQKLIDFLAQLNCASSELGLWVDKNLESYRIGDIHLENGGLLDDKVFIGTLENLSFGYQSQEEAIKTYLDAKRPTLYFKGKKVICDRDGIVAAWLSRSLDPEFSQFLESEAETIEHQQSMEEAEMFVDELWQRFNEE